MTLKNRTPFGNFGGKLKDITATDLGAKLDPALVDMVQVGNVAPTSPDGAYIARHVQLKAGIPQDKPALTINRLCGSGFQSVVGGTQEILLGEAEIALCGGAENMSQSPLAVYGHQARFGVGLDAMGMTAENLADKYKITREECDAFGLRSQTRWAEAQAAGWFDAELAPLEVKAGRKTEEFAVDESPRTVDMAKLAKLKPVFKKDGVVTAGNASGVSDGAGAVLLASEEAVKKHNLTPLARIVSYQRAGLKKSDIDIYDINEAFAAQWLSCVKELEIDPDIVNQSGGAIALGHPLGASGSRITAHLAHALQRTGKKYAVGSACIGGGQGIALVLENAA
ncbi:Thiolase, C-terminal [Phytophthora cactorum]|nr:Thiolase, C-terminal [Phytophthora cactorum]